ncbi:unnamed protein product [Lampetra planeri]
MPRPPHRNAGTGTRQAAYAGEASGPHCRQPAALAFRGVPPQSNSPPDTVPGAGRARHHERCSGARGTWSQKREPPAGLASPPHRARVKLNRVFFPR